MCVHVYDLLRDTFASITFIVKYIYIYIYRVKPLYKNIMFSLFGNVFSIRKADVIVSHVNILVL